MIELYQARVVDLLEAAGIVSGVGSPPDNIRTPYTFVWGPPVVEDSVTAAGCDENVNLEFHIQVVADQAANVHVEVAKVKAAVKDKALPIDGWHCSPLEVIGATQVQTETTPVEPSTNQPVAWCTLHIRFQADKE